MSNANPGAKAAPAARWVYQVLDRPSIMEGGCSGRNFWASMSGPSSTILSGLWQAVGRAPAEGWRVEIVPVATLKSCQMTGSFRPLRPPFWRVGPRSWHPLAWQPRGKAISYSDEAHVPVLVHFYVFPPCPEASMCLMMNIHSWHPLPSWFIVNRTLCGLVWQKKAVMRRLADVPWRACGTTYLVPAAVAVGAVVAPVWRVGCEWAVCRSTPFNNIHCSFLLAEISRNSPSSAIRRI